MKNIILDLDTGVDDALALSYVLMQSHDIRLLGVTATFGNVETEASAANTLRVLSLFGRDDIPVYTGRKGPWGKDSYKVMDYVYTIHGRNGLGEACFPESGRKPEEEDAVSFMSRMIGQYGDDLTIVTTGPLTNLASLYREHPECISAPHHVISMGGALTVKGNIEDIYEANIYKDALSAEYVFSLPIDLSLIGLDVTERSHLSLDDVAEWKNKRGLLFREMTEFYIAFHRRPYCFLHDSSAACAVLHPEFFTFIDLPITATEKGRTVADYEKANPLKKVALSVDSQKVERELKMSWLKAFGE